MKIKSFITLFCIIAFAILSRAQTTVLHHFPGPGLAGVGANFMGALISDGTFLYGVQSVDGTYGYGYIYKIKPDGTLFDTLLNFTGTNGAKPYGSLLFDGTFLYGTTYAGGINNDGIVFKIKPDGTSYTILHHFASINGKGSSGALISDGTFLYGMTSEGGINNTGIVFKIKPDGTLFAKILDFVGTSNGATPYGSLLFDGTYLYGMTYGGGTDAVGVIFKLLPSGAGYVKIYDFSPSISGGFGMGSLISDGTYLYGMAYVYGPTSSGGGIVFKIKPDGTGFTDILDFIFSNGYQPAGDLFYSGGFLYGMTQGGGFYSGGVVFKIKPDGTGYVNLADLGDMNGEWSWASVFLDATHVYGVTSYGGLNNSGTIFKLSKQSVGMNEDELQNTFSIFPNPAGETIHINFSQVPENENILTIMDVMGKEMLTQTVNKFQTASRIEVASFPPGVYFICFNNKRAVFVKE